MQLLILLQIALFKRHDINVAFLNTVHHRYTADSDITRGHEVARFYVFEG